MSSTSLRPFQDTSTEKQTASGFPASLVRAALALSPLAKAWPLPASQRDG